MNIARNYLYNLVYQIVVLLVPLITIPYISRTLGSEGVGINAYTFSIVQYFVLIGTIGITIYGNRTIAYYKDNKEQLSRIFWSIFYLKIITTIISSLGFFIFLFYIEEYTSIFMVQSIYIIAAMFDITWLYMGLEDFRKTVMRNLVVKIIGIISIFIFVKNSEDLWIYVLILAGSQLFGHLTLYMYLPKTVIFVKVSFREIFNHLYPTFALFIPQISLQVYLVLNKTMLGLYTNASEVGIFDNSDKVIRLALSVVTAMGVVMLPRIANTFARGDLEKVNEYLYSSFKFASYLGIPLVFGIIGIVPNFTPWFFGQGFEDTVVVMSILSPMIIFIAWSNVMGTQYLLAIGKNSFFTISVTIGASINLVLNFFLIPKYFASGAAVATLIAEFSVTLLQFIMIRKYISIRKSFDGLGKFLISGIIMFGIVWYIGLNFNATIITTFVQIFSGLIIYVLCLTLFKSDINNKIIRFIIKTLIPKYKFK